MSLTKQDAEEVLENVNERRLLPTGHEHHPYAAVGDFRGPKSSQKEDIAALPGNRKQRRKAYFSKRRLR